MARRQRLHDQPIAAPMPKLKVEPEPPHRSGDHNSRTGITCN
jgi:hypothetical protein